MHREFLAQNSHSDFERVVLAQGNLDRHQAAHAAAELVFGRERAGSHLRQTGAALGIRPVEFPKKLSCCSSLVAAKGIC